MSVLKIKRTLPETQLPLIYHLPTEVTKSGTSIDAIYPLDKAGKTALFFVNPDIDDVLGLSDSSGKAFMSNKWFLVGYAEILADATTNTAKATIPIPNTVFLAIASCSIEISENPLRSFWDNKPDTDDEIHWNEKKKAANIVWSQVPTQFKDELQIYAEAFNLQHLPSGYFLLNNHDVFMMAVCSYLTPLDNLADVALALGNTISEWINNNRLPNVQVTVPFLTEMIS